MPQSGAANPMSCRVEGRVLRVLPIGDVDSGSVCSRYPCKALVRVIDVSLCGQAVSAPLHAGDTVTVNFAYTLEKTSVAIPSMKATYPGLKKGNHFIANVEQRLAPGSGGSYTVYDYQVTR